MYLSISQASNLIGVSPSTLRLWERNGRLKPAYRTFGGHRRYVSGLGSTSPAYPSHSLVCRSWVHEIEK